MPHDDSAALHPIQIVARRTGLSTDLIRAWERRYGAVTPARTDTRRRLYSEADVQRLDLLRRAVERGRRIGDLAALEREVIESLLAQDSADRLPRPRPGRRRAGRNRIDTVNCAGFIEESLEAVAVLDGPALERVLDEASVALSVPVLLEQVLTPLLHRLGEGWRDGSLRVCHEHFASGVLRAFLGSLAARTRGNTRDAPHIVLATPPGHAHEFGVLMASVMASTCGWRPVYLGAENPVDEIAFAAVSRGARVVALGLTWPGDDGGLTAELQRLRERLPPAVQLLVGGEACVGYAAVLGAMGAHCCHRLTDLCRVLDRLRRTPASVPP